MPSRRGSVRVTVTRHQSPVTMVPLYAEGPTPSTTKRTRFRTRDSGLDAHGFDVDRLQWGAYLAAGAGTERNCVE